MYRSLAILARALLLPIAASAATVHVPGDQTTIQAGINAAGYRKAESDTEGPYLRVGDVPPGGWDCVTTVPALMLPGYSVVSPTMCDSTIVEGICWSVFFVSAHTTGPSLYYICAPDSGYSVDNLAPSAPGNSRIEAPDLLAWDSCGDSDFNYFTLYGSTVEHLDESAEVIRVVHQSAQPRPRHHEHLLRPAGALLRAASCTGSGGACSGSAGQ